jgi:outer membrane protein
MKIARFFAAVAVLTVAAFCVSAQQKPATPAAPPATAPQTVAVPDSKMAMIYSDAFLDPKTGIARFNSLLGTLSVADPNAIRTKREQLAQMTTELKRKGEDAEAAYTKRRQEIFLPLQQDIGKALEAFAKARGITVIVDGSQVPVVYAADNIDITRAFIADFNSKNPATASVTQP